MHLTYYFLKHFSSELNKRLTGKKIGDCYSQSKDELIIGFYDQQTECYLSISLLPEFPHCAYSEEYHRKNKNTITLFEEILDLAVKGVQVIPFDRSFNILLENDNELLIKMHGRRSNVLLCTRGNVVALFRNLLKEDQNLQASLLPNPPQDSKEQFFALGGNIRQVNPLFDHHLRNYLLSYGYEELSLEAKYAFYQNVKATIEEGKQFYIIERDKKVWLSFFEEPSVIDTADSALIASQLYKRNFYAVEKFQKEKELLEEEKRKEIKSLQKKLKDLEKALHSIKTSEPISHKADSIMAYIYNLTSITKPQNVPNLYGGKDFTIQLKENQTPQEYAQKLYKKAKNQHLELEELENRKSVLEKNLYESEEALRKIESLSTLREVHKYEDKLQKIIKKDKIDGRFKRYVIEGFVVYVGRNSKNNDELTLKEAVKEDYWLHAKDVAGSHVVIKHQSGKAPSKEVIRQAVGLAAKFSKLKSQQTVPVILTKKKYVRKRKGDPPGAVVVEKEQIVLGSPSDAPEE